jgi:serine/threonine protein kinase
VITEFGSSSKVTDNSLIAGNCRGIPGYLAPELLTPGPYDQAVDIWALGCILYELSLHRPAFADDVELLDFVENMRYLDLSLTVQSVAGSINLMLQIAPDKRPSAGELHARFKGLSSLPETPGWINWSELLFMKTTAGKRQKFWSR